MKYGRPVPCIPVHMTNVILDNAKVYDKDWIIQLEKNYVKGFKEIQDNYYLSDTLYENTFSKEIIVKGKKLETPYFLILPK